MNTYIKFLGARDTVTGSCTLLSSDGKNYLIDCGLFQGPKEVRQRNWLDFSIDVKKIDAVFLSHAHLDHSGSLPRLVKAGYSGPIYMTKATNQLARLLLTDAAFLEEEFARFANETDYSNHKPALPLFTREDVDKAVSLFKPIARQEWIQTQSGHGFRFHRAGHIPGASYVEFSKVGAEKPQRILFTGDVGNDRLFTMRAPENFANCEEMVLESTYGNRLQPRGDTLTEFAEIIAKTYEKKGVLVIPSFAVGRAQEIIYLIKILESQKKIPKIPVILDSPMSIQATELFLSHPEDHRLDITPSNSDSDFEPELFEMSSSTNDSMLATMRDGPLIVISAAGMLSGGRILHHLRHRLPHEENTVLFTGYQAEGSKGRYLQDNANTASTLRIHHKEVEINASIQTLDGLSSHADYQDLLEQISRMKNKPKRIFLNHGSEHSQQEFATKIKEKFGIECITAYSTNGEMQKLF